MRSAPRRGRRRLSVFVRLEKARFAELAEVDAAAEFALGETHSRFQFAQLGLDLVELGGVVVAVAVLRHLGVTELPLEGREQVERVAAAGNASSAEQRTGSNRCAAAVSLSTVSVYMCFRIGERIGYPFTSSWPP